jgi:integrase
MTRRRRGRGEGAIRERADRLWEARISLGYGLDGKRVSKSVYGKTKKEVQEKLRELQDNHARGIAVDAGEMTLAAWLGRWLKMIQPTVEQNTYGPYERHVRLHIVPLLGAIRLSKLRRGDIVGFYPALAQQEVSPAMQRKIGTTLTIALNKAVDLDLIPSNPATKVDKPRAPKAEIQVLDVDQIARFQRAAEGDRLHALYVTATDSGARPGELFALLWPDVDFDRGFLSIMKSLEGINGALRVKDVKTAKSRRRIDLSSHTLAILASHRERMLTEGHCSTDRPVFCDTDGGYLRLSKLHKNSFKPILARAGLPAIRLYALRHTCATMLLLADVPAKVVSERLGHSSITLTLDTYSHVLPTMQQRAADVMGLVLSRKPVEKPV